MASKLKKLAPLGNAPPVPAQEEDNIASRLPLVDNKAGNKLPPVVPKDGLTDDLKQAEELLAGAMPIESMDIKYPHDMDDDIKDDYEPKKEVEFDRRSDAMSMSSFSDLEKYRNFQLVRLLTCRVFCKFFNVYCCVLL